MFRKSAFSIHITFFPFSVWEDKVFPRIDIIIFVHLLNSERFCDIIYNILNCRLLPKVKGLSRMNSKKISIFRIGGISAAFLSVFASVFYVIAYMNDYDITIRHFETGSVTATIFTVLFFIVAAVVTVCAILIRRGGKLSETDPSQIETFALWLTAFMFFAFGAISVAFAEPTLTSNSLIGTLASKLITPLALLSALPFVFAVSSRLRGSALHGFTSFFPIMWGVCLLFKYYFDIVDMPLNDPELALTTVCISALVIFFISEARSALGINSPAIAFFCNSIAVCVGGCVSTSRIILSLITTHTFPSLMENVIFFVISVLALVRLLVLEDKFTSPEVEFDALSETEAIEDDSISTADDNTDSVK